MFQTLNTELKELKKVFKYPFPFITLAVIVMILYLGTTFHREGNGSVWQRNGVYYHPLWRENKAFLISTPGCSIPKFNPFDSTVRRFFIKTPYKFACGGQRSVFLVSDNGVVSLKENELWRQYKVQKNDIDCYFSPILRNTEVRKPDDMYIFGKRHDMVFGLPIEEDFIKVNCLQGNTTIVQDILALTPLKPKVEDRCEKAREKSGITRENLNVLLVGIDSISKLNFLRYFRRSAAYLRDNLSAVELHGYNKVADNTYPNLIPMLTGHHSSYYKDKEKRRKYYDDADLIWKRYSDVGYRTLFSEDAPKIATFNLNRRGFKFPPVDYYTRSFSLAYESSKLRRRTYCFGSKLEMEVYFDYLRHFVSTMKDRHFFAFSFMARLTHDIFEMAGFADRPSCDLLRYLDKSGILNRTVMLFFSDHGIRFGNIRQTYIGKMEERMPFAFLVIPDWFYERYPIFAANLRINEKRLTTPYDIHATLLHLLDLQKEEYFTAHGQSLLDEISPMRTCEDAMIEPHWCTCQIHQPVPIDDFKVKQVASAVISKINSFLKPYYNKCAKLKLDIVLDARIGRPLKAMLSNKKGEPSKKPVSYSDYLITLRVQPSEGIFEATVRSQRNHLNVVDDVSRINIYGNQSYCVDEPIMKKYCFCKDLMNHPLT